MMTTAIPAATVLHGYTRENPYVVPDHPFGSARRCRARYWIETKDAGAKKGQQRMVVQTSTPKPHDDRWNRPQPRLYAPLVAMYADGGCRVHAASIIAYGVSPETDAWFRLTGIHDQLDPVNRVIYDMYLTESKEFGVPWDRWGNLLTALTDYRHLTGLFPARDNRGLRAAAGFVGERTYDIAVAWLARHGG